MEKFAQLNRGHVRDLVGELDIIDANAIEIRNADRYDFAARYRRPGLFAGINKAARYYDKVTNSMLVPGKDIHFDDWKIADKFTKPQIVEEITAIMESENPAFYENIPFVTSRGKFIVWLARGGRCEYCKSFLPMPSQTMQADHIVPSSDGGLTERSNLACSCKRCNKAKGDMDPLEFMEHTAQQDGDKWFAERYEKQAKHFQDQREGKLHGWIR